MNEKKALNFLFSLNTENWTQGLITELHVQPKAVILKKASLFAVFIFIYSEVEMLIITLIYA